MKTEKRIPEKAIVILGILGISREDKRKRYKQAKAKARKVYRVHHGKKKAGLWVCHRLMPGDEPLFQKGKCFKCNADISFDPSLKENMRKDAKKICRECVISEQKYTKDMSKEEKAILGVKQNGLSMQVCKKKQQRK